MGYRYAILADKAFVEQLPAATRAMIETEIVLIIAEGDAASYLQDLNTLAVIIRPDRHILGTAVTLQQLYTVLDRRRPQTWFELRTHASFDVGGTLGNGDVHRAIVSHSHKCH